MGTSKIHNTIEEISRRIIPSKMNQQKTKGWFHEECIGLAEERKRRRIKLLTNDNADSIENYKQLLKKLKNKFRGKKNFNN